MLQRIVNKLRWRAEGIDGRIALSYARAAATCAARRIDVNNPITWEFAGFSQHGEDGIHDFLCANLIRPNRFFFEIGSAGGLENCSTWFAMARGYGGVMVEGNPQRAVRCQRLCARMLNVHAIQLMVTPENVGNLIKMCPMRDPDLFILDIDSVDYHILKKVLELGLRPRIVTVEYNSSLGPERALTIPLRPEFDRFQAHASGLYYGASIRAWRKLLEKQGYQFLTVESNGVNAFFADPAAFAPGFLASVHGLEFLDNFSDMNAATCPRIGADGVHVMPARDWRTQFELIKGMEFVEV
jgi:hypothetical protein